MKDIAFGQYFPGNSVIHRLDPRMKIILSILYIVMVFFADSFIAYMTLGGFIVLITILSRIPLRTVFNALKPILFLLFFIMILNILFYKGQEIWVSFAFIRIYKEAPEFAAKMALRLIFLVIGPAFLTLTTTPIALTNALEKLLSPLKVIHFPVHTLALIMSIALRCIPTLMDETERIMKAQKARGANLDTGSLVQRAKALLPVLIPLFVSAFSRAAELADAMNARCYNGEKGRTQMRVYHYHARDLFALLTLCLFFTALLMMRYSLSPFLPF